MLTRPEAATLALFALGGEGELIDTEDVAIRAGEIAPGMFSWRKYRNQIDKELVRVALSDARLKIGYVLGSHRRGWMLTSKGAEFARKISLSADEHPTPERKSRDDEQWQRERLRLLTSDAFRRFQEKGAEAVSADEADTFFRLSVYMRGEGRERKIARIENHFGDDSELGDAIRCLSAKARERAQ